MALLRYKKRSYLNYAPASYTASAAKAIMSVASGDLVGSAFCRVTVVFNGSNSDAIMTLGDGGDVDRFLDTGDITDTTLGLYGPGTGAGFAEAGYLYTATDTIDVDFTRDTGADGSAGKADFWCYIAKVDPH